MEPDKQQIATAMIDFGGSFVQALGGALMRADHVNAVKIQQAFPEYWRQYSVIALERMKKEQER